MKAPHRPTGPAIRLMEKSPEVAAGNKRSHAESSVAVRPRMHRRVAHKVGHGVVLLWEEDCRPLRCSAPLGNKAQLLRGKYEHIAPALAHLNHVDRIEAGPTQLFSQVTYGVGSGTFGDH